MQFCLNILKILVFTRFCRKIVNVVIYALYPESFSDKDHAIRKVFAFSDSGGGASIPVAGCGKFLTILQNAYEGGGEGSVKSNFIFNKNHAF